MREIIGGGGGVVTRLGARGGVFFFDHLAGLIREGRRVFVHLRALI